MPRMILPKQSSKNQQRTVPNIYTLSEADRAEIVRLFVDGDENGKMIQTSRLARRFNIGVLKLQAVLNAADIDLPKVREERRQKVTRRETKVEVNPFVIHKSVDLFLSRPA